MVSAVLYPHPASKVHLFAPEIQRTMSVLTGHAGSCLHAPKHRTRRAWRDERMYFCIIGIVAAYPSSGRARHEQRQGIVLQLAAAATGPRP